jgi:hypothetical protein
MNHFRRVEADQAGPSALGILVPPGKRTFVILRPRSLHLDLLLLREPEGTVFRDLAHDEASATAQALYRALRDGSLEVSLRPLGQAALFYLVATIGVWTLLACPRVPGQPYQPLTGREQEMAVAAANLGSLLRPANGSDQELYFNTRFYER